MDLWGCVYRFGYDLVWQSITQHALIKNNHKTCADQKQSSEVFVFHTPHFLFLFYDPTRINQARLRVLISGNLLLRKARNQV